MSELGGQSNEGSVSHNEDDDVRIPSKRRKRYEIWLGFEIFTRNSLEFAKCKYWKVLKKKIINFQHIEYPHDGPALSKVLRDSTLDWNIDRKLFSLVVDNASANDWMVKDLKLWLCQKSLRPLEGVLFHVRCSAHILNLIVFDGLKMIKETIGKIRKNVRYLTHWNYDKQKFENAKKHCKLENMKKVPSDVFTRWNSTYLMLEAADLKDAFSRLSEIDSNMSIIQQTMNGNMLSYFVSA
uniref:Uncharacterized protein n=1 Tax=Kalanchoe fedtschenkoi TaxID=63787 RepID=A0A7N1A9I4_KALFE